jgi:hypothetical protein
MELRSRKPFIFIVYQDFEHELAYHLQKLLEIWGYEAFQCRQQDRDDEFYRRELREKFRRCDLVILLLSREFRWSPYCQAEAGTTMALDKPFIPVIVPPATRDEIQKDKIAPVLEGAQFISAKNPKFPSLLKAQIVAELRESRARMDRLVSELRDIRGFNLPAEQTRDLHQEELGQQHVLSSIAKIDEKYRLLQPKRAALSFWPSLSDQSCRSSVIGNIKKLLAHEGEDVALTFVGVSLKYSLYMITDALREFHAENSVTPSPSKTLRITLIYMDSASHILHAFADERDIDAIRTSFGINWPAIKEEWKDLCAGSIHLQEPTLHRIDYIPPRVGLLLELGNPEKREVPVKQSILYAGRCAFRQPNFPLPIFNLDVGENEYFVYTSSADSETGVLSAKAIEEFKSSVSAYKGIQNNSGITPVWGSDSWIERLRKHIDDLQGDFEITFVSRTATKFQPLIVRSLDKGASVRVYVCAPGEPPLRARDLFERLERARGPRARTVEVYRYRHAATFRGVVIKDRLVGLQVYANSDLDSSAPGNHATPDILRNFPLCLLVTPCFKSFAELQSRMLAFAEEDSLAREKLEFA